MIWILKVTKRHVFSATTQQNLGNVPPLFILLCPVDGFQWHLKLSCSMPNLWERTQTCTRTRTHISQWEKKNVVAHEEVLVGGIPNLPFFARQESYLNHLESMLGQCLAQPFFHQLSWTWIAFVPRPMIRSLVLVTLLQLKAHFQGQQRWTTRVFVG